MIIIMFFCIWSSWVSSHRSAGWAVTMLIRAVGVWLWSHWITAHFLLTVSITQTHTACAALQLMETDSHCCTDSHISVFWSMLLSVCVSQWDRRISAEAETCRKFCKVKKTKSFEYSPKSQSHCLKRCVLLGRMPTTWVFVSQSESCNTTLSQSLSCGTESHPQCQGVMLNLYHCALSTLVSHLWDRLLLLACSLFPAWPLLRQT